MIKKHKQFPSELRFDVASQDWVVIATGRARRPETFKVEKRVKSKLAKADCPFCKIETQEPPTLIFAHNKPVVLNGKIPRQWTTLTIPNKFPAFIPDNKLIEKREGPFFRKVNAAGFHEVVVFRNHEKSLGQFTIDQVKEVVDVYQARYLSLMQEKLVNYISIFHNEGAKAGASISHPHSQIITTPLIDIDLKKALNSAKSYYQKTKKCIYCQMNAWELKDGKRMVFENKHFVVLCPFASKSAFQMIISPKRHSGCFGEIREEEKWSLAEAFKQALSKLYKGLNNPDYNFYLHTAPCDGKPYPCYHWHWTVIPKTSTWAGFELGARMEISTIEPEAAAAYLRKQ